MVKNKFDILKWRPKTKMVRDSDENEFEWF